MQPVKSSFGAISAFRTPYTLIVSAVSMDISTIDILQDTIILTGTLTGNTTIILNAAVRCYRVINNCTGSYNICIKTAVGSGVFIAPGDMLEMACDGTNVKLIRLLLAGSILTMANLTYNQASGNTTIPLSSGTFTNNVLNEVSSNAFIPKNTGYVSISGYMVPSVAQGAMLLTLQEDGGSVIAGSRNNIATATSELRCALSTVLRVTAGKSYILVANFTSADTGARLLYLRITRL